MNTRFFHLGLFSVVVLLFVGCSDPSSPPKEEKPEGTDSARFKITAVIPDTLYTGEHGWITVKELGDTLEHLSLFVHTVPATILKISEDTLFFEVPRNATTSRLRLYKHDSLEATGEFILQLLPHHINFDFAVYTFMPDKGYEGDLIRITGNDFPLRKREIEVSIDGISLDVVAFSPTEILARITPQAKSGVVEVTLRGSPFSVGSFTLLNHGGKLLQSNYYFESIFQVQSLDAEFDLKGFPDSVIASTGKPSLGTMVKCSTMYTLTRSDSIRISIDENNPDGRRRIVYSLAEIPGKNEVSGTILLEQILFEGMPHEIVEHVALTVRNIRWRNNGADFEIYAEGPDITSKVLSLEYEQRSQNTTTQIVKYRGGDISSRFSLKLR